MRVPPECWCYHLFMLAVLVAVEWQAWGWGQCGGGLERSLEGLAGAVRVGKGWARGNQSKRAELELGPRGGHAGLGEGGALQTKKGPTVSRYRELPFSQL